MQSNIMIQDQNIPKYSEDWRFVEFHLKSSISSEVEIQKIGIIPNQHMMINFEKRTKNKLYTYAWKNFRTQDDKNSITKLRSRGFEVPKDGMDFIVGSLYDENSDEAMEGESTYILCKIIIGRSYCKIIREKDENSKYAMENAFKNNKPAGYDSILFCPSDANSNKSTKMGWGITKSFRYRIYDSVNILPIYWVQFNHIDITSPVYSTKHMCGECQYKEADFYCYNCEDYICSPCYDNIHGDNTNDKNIKNIFDHEKEPLKSKIKTGKCVSCLDKDVEFYCNNCKITICSYCRIIGSHSKGEAAFHVLEEIGTAYKRLIPDNLEIIKISENRKNQAQDTLKSIKEQIRQIKETNFINAQKEIKKAYEEEIQYLQAKSTECMLSHLSLMNELIVIKDMINWLDKYFIDRENYLKESNNKAEFIWVWNHHNKMIQEIINNKSFVNLQSRFNAKEFEIPKMNELIINHFHFKESSNVKEQYKDDEDSKKIREGQKKR
jgi:hypothetical protein